MFIGLSSMMIIYGMRFDGLLFVIIKLLRAKIMSSGIIAHDGLYSMQRLCTKFTRDGKKNQRRTINTQQFLTGSVFFF